MKAVILAAGPGRRLQPLTDALPKTLLPLDGARTILDVALENLQGVGIDEVVVVAGFASERLEERVPELERRHGVNLEVLFNDRAEEWNNAYSLWLARGTFRDGVVLVNGDTVHPASIEENLLMARGPGLLLAVDRRKPLGDEEMKVVLSEEGRLRQISKTIPPREAHGEYIGVALVEPTAAEPLAEALEATWRRDPSRYYEDGFQEFVDRGGHIAAVDTETSDWVEVDDHDDLARARELQCLS